MQRLMTTGLGMLFPLALAAALNGCDSWSQCACMGEAIALTVLDGTGAVVTPDALSYTQDGELTEFSAEELEQGGIFIGGTGTFHLWVTYQGQEWESEDITVEMGGPEECRLPETVAVDVTFETDPETVDAVTEELGAGC